MDYVCRAETSGSGIWWKQMRYDTEKSENYGRSFVLCEPTPSAPMSRQCASYQQPVNSPIEAITKNPEARRRYMNMRQCFWLALRTDMTFSINWATGDRRLPTRPACRTSSDKQSRRASIDQASDRRVATVETMHGGITKPFCLSCLRHG
jgi:hypothetical protein